MTDFPPRRKLVPWGVARVLWQLPWYPVRLYLHFWDKVLFQLWLVSRRPMWWLEDQFMNAGKPKVTVTDAHHPTVDCAGCRELFGGEAR